MAPAEGGVDVKVNALAVDGACLLESPVWHDDRGLFREWFKYGDLDEAGLAFTIRQANLSVSARDVVRGLHYSLAPQGQAKIVTCAHGELVDVIADVRVGSPTFGRVDTVRLAAGDGRSVLLPAGVAHGFCVTSETGALTYLLSSPYDAAVELEINPFDATLAVAWPLAGAAIVSNKDRTAPTLAQRAAADELPAYAPSSSR